MASLVHVEQFEEEETTMARLQVSVLQKWPVEDRGAASAVS
jgi:hypothetical protein